MSLNFRIPLSDTGWARLGLRIGLNSDFLVFGSRGASRANASRVEFDLRHRAKLVQKDLRNTDVVTARWIVGSPGKCISCSR